MKQSIKSEYFYHSHYLYANKTKQKHVQTQLKVTVLKNNINFIQQTKHKELQTQHIYTFKTLIHLQCNDFQPTLMHVKLTNNQIF